MNSTIKGLLCIIVGVCLYIFFPLLRGRGLLTLCIVAGILVPMAHIGGKILYVALGSDTKRRAYSRNRSSFSKKQKDFFK